MYDIVYSVCRFIYINTSIYICIIVYKTDVSMSKYIFYTEVYIFCTYQLCIGKYMYKHLDIL